MWEGVGAGRVEEVGGCGTEVGYYGVVGGFLGKDDDAGENVGIEDWEVMYCGEELGDG